MVADDHEVAGPQCGIYPSRGVREQQAAASHAAQKLHGQHDGRPAFAFVVVAASAPRGDAPPLALVENEFAGMPRHGGGA